MCCVVLLNREWGGPFPGLSQQCSGPLAIAGSSTYQGGAAIDTPPDTFSTAFDPPVGDFHFISPPRTTVAYSPDEELSLLGNQ